MKDTWESSGVDIPRRLMKLRVTTSIMDHIDNKRMECWIYTLKNDVFKGHKNDHQIWIPMWRVPKKSQLIAVHLNVGM